MTQSWCERCCRDRCTRSPRRTRAHAPARRGARRCCACGAAPRRDRQRLRDRYAVAPARPAAAAGRRRRRAAAAAACAARRQPRRMAAAAAPLPRRRIDPPDLARRARPGRCRRDAGRQHAAGRALPAGRAGGAGGRVRAAPRRGARRRRQRAAAGRVRPGQARRRRAQLQLRHRPGLRLSSTTASRDGARPLAAEDYFARLGQQLAKLLDELTADGFCHRVDLRLRPFGNAGRVALSFAAMEQYFQREGRDWERYAWQKARPVAGDIDAGERFLADAAPVRLPPLPRLRRARRPARDEGGDRRRSRAQGTGRRHQARPRRHPRDRIPGAGAAADPRRPRTGLARTPPAAGAAGAGARRGR